MSGITQVAKLPPMILNVAKTSSLFTDWREDVANGAPHPLEIEHIQYMRCTIGWMEIDSTLDYQNHHGYNLSIQEQLEEHEAEALKTFLRDPKIAWAVDNSFDGIYITKEIDHPNFRVLFTFMVYLKEDHVTFWRLKYSGI